MQRAQANRRPLKSRSLSFAAPIFFHLTRYFFT
jgi:hypothetical protein